MILLDKIKNPWILAIISGVILFLSWPVFGFPLLIFFALIPLFQIDKKVEKGIKAYGAVYLALLIWNVLTTWWVYNSTPVALVAFSANALLQSIPYIAFRYTRKWSGDTTAYLASPIYWVSFEYIHLSWEFSWPWLTLGNVFAEYPEWVQWYEYTGVLGGSVWVLIVNFLLFKVLSRPFNPRALTGPIFLLVLPLLLSYTIYWTYKEKGNPVEAVVIQPNIDPYTQKFEGSKDFIPFDEQLNSFLFLSDSLISPKTALVFWPETAIDDQIEEKEIKENFYYQKIRDFVLSKPGIKLVTGLTTYKRYGEDPETHTSRYYEGFGYYDVFNSALTIEPGREPMFYHKSKLVPGVEIMPYSNYLFFLKSLAIDLGGTSGGFGYQKERTVLFPNSGLEVAPSICYESIYGSFMSNYARNGAKAIGIITNDAWWGDTPGYKQHMNYARLRAIELRKPIIRSANTGISCFIDQKGEIISQTPYWKRTGLRETVLFNDELTFFSRYGDYIGRIFSLLSVGFLLSSFTRGIRKGK